MADATQLALAISVPTFAVLIGILVNNSRLTDLRAHVDLRINDLNARINGLNGRFDDLKDTFRAELLRVEQVMDARLRHLEENR